MSEAVPENPALDDVENGDEFAGEEVGPEHDLDVNQFDLATDGDIDG